jgi:hypothetical protein
MIPALGAGGPGFDYPLTPRRRDGVFFLHEKRKYDAPQRKWEGKTTPKRAMWCGKCMLLLQKKGWGNGGSICEFLSVIL